MRLVRLVGLVAAAVLALPLAAFAKGASGAALEGQGIDGTLIVDQAGELGQGTAMSMFAERAEFFPLVFGDDSGQTAGQKEALVADGTKPTIVVTWDMVGTPIVQDLYFLKDGSVVAYMAPGQSFWEDTAQTVGGWMPIRKDLTKTLAELGVNVTLLPHKVGDPVTAAAPKVVTPAPEALPVDPAPLAPSPAAPPPDRGVPGAAWLILLAAGLVAAGYAGRKRMLAG